MSTRSELIQFLKGNWLFGALMDEELKDLVDHSLVMTFQEDYPVTVKGEANDAIWLILKGRVAVESLEDPFHEDPKLILGVDSMFGEMSWLDGHPASATLTCLEECTLLKIPFGEIEDFYGRYPAAYTTLLRKFAINLSARLRQNQK